MENLDSKPLRASVVVCTRNRSVKLLEACNSILELDYPADRWELLIVDNGSTDDTPAVARGFAEQHPDLVRVVDEPELGLSAARNTGVREARGELLVFIDDDAFPAKGWLKALDEALSSPDVLAAGGPVDPEFLGELPDWFTERYLPYVSAFEKDPEIQTLHHNEYPRGANIAFRRDAFERVGLFSVDLGRKGDRLRSCEESELCLRLERTGAKVVYHPEARIRHQVDAERLTTKWMQDRFHAQGESEAVVAWQHGGLRELIRGWLRYLKNTLHARSQRGEESALYARLQLESLIAYTLGAPKVMATSERYRPPAAAGELAAWRPSGPAGTWSFPAQGT